MKNKLLLTIIIFISMLAISGCSFKKQENNTKININENNSNEVISSMKIKINDVEYSIILEENDTAMALSNLLPLNIKMNELNGNEKYAYLDKNLPTNSTIFKQINSGDVMLFGSNCLVIFYESFDTSYSYTKIGHIDNLPNLGNDSISVLIEKN